MKKVGVLVFLISFLILSSLSLNLVQAQDAAESGEDVIKEIEITTEKLTDTDYLNQEWKNFIGILKNNPIIKFLDPYFKFVFGLEFSWSWEFLLTVILWFVFATYLYRLFQGITIVLEKTHPKIIKVSVIWPILAVLIVWITKIAKIAGTYAGKEIKLLGSLPEQLIIIMVLVFALLYSIAYSKLLKKYFIALRLKLKLERAVKGGKTDEDEAAGREFLKKLGKEI